MSDIDRAELRRLLAEATQGPWEAEGSQVWGPDGVLVAAVREHSTIVDRPDALIIAAAVNALPDLLDALEKAEGYRACVLPDVMTASTLLVAIALLSTHPQQHTGREIADRLLRVLQALPTTEPTEGENHE